MAKKPPEKVIHGAVAGCRGPTGLWGMRARAEGVWVSVVLRPPRRGFADGKLPEFKD